MTVNMKFRIPFTFSDIDKLKDKSEYFIHRLKRKEKSKITERLKFLGLGISREEYLGICARSFVINFIVLYVISTTIMALFRMNLFYFYGLGISLLVSLFIFVNQITYIKIYLNKKQRDIEKNLVSALNDILIQLNSGIPLFNIMNNISNANYGILSEEFKEAVKRINTGEPESEVLDDLGKKNPSVFFRRTLWQISNAMRAGSDLSAVIRDSINNLNDEQSIQIQNYGSTLNPLVVLYMLISVIVPALSITFLTVISSMISLSSNTTTLLFVSLLVFDIFAQIMFLGLIKSRKPSLL